MIYLAELKDIDNIMEIIKEAKEEMINEHNPQWASTEEDYPNKEKFLNDIKEKVLYIIKEENELKGLITIAKDNNEYDELIENSKEKSYILHRMCVPKKYRNQGIASKLIIFAEDLAIKNNVKVLKADTEVSNTKMNNLFIKLGYIKKGTFIYDDYPGEYIYYEKYLGSDKNEL